jgi:DNA-binding protein H-NS
VHVGTTYKRALPQKNLGRDQPVSASPGDLTALCRLPSYRFSIIMMETTMRKPRDFDAELKALGDKARDLKSRKVQQLGELVIATGADALNADELAGALIVLAETKEAGKREAWARRGAAFFQRRAQRTAPAAERNTGGARAQPGGAQPSTGSKGTA